MLDMDALFGGVVNSLPERQIWRDEPLTLDGGRAGEGDE